MLANQAKLVIIGRISSKVGYTVKEEELSPAVKRSITALASIEKTLAIIEEISRGQKTRVVGSAILSIASRIRPDKENSKVKGQVEELRNEIEKKIVDISNRILSEEKSGKTENSNDVRTGINQVTELKCTKCGAPLQIPTSEYLKCPYCGTTMFIQDFTQQLSSLVKLI